jgi:hypothetical protein
VVLTTGGLLLLVQDVSIPSCNQIGINGRGNLRTSSRLLADAAPAVANAITFAPAVVAHTGVWGRHGDTAPTAPTENQCFWDY